MDNRPRGGRRSEDYPEAVARDTIILGLLRGVWPGGFSRNELADRADCTRAQARYSLNRLRARGRVQHIKQGNEGHGFWAVAEKETETDGS